jgi:hypothetical protein
LNFSSSVSQEEIGSSQQFLFNSSCMALAKLGELTNCYVRSLRVTAYEAIISYHLKRCHKSIFRIFELLFDLSWLPSEDNGTEISVTQNWDFPVFLSQCYSRGSHERLIIVFKSFDETFHLNDSVIIGMDWSGAWLMCRILLERCNRKFF